MSNLLNIKSARAIATKAIKAGFVLSLVAISSATTAKEVSFQEMVDYTMATQLQTLRYDQQIALQQSFYTAVYASINNDYNLSNGRTVISISDATSEEDEDE